MHDACFFYEETLCTTCRQHLEVSLSEQQWGGYLLVTLYRYQATVRSFLLAIKVKQDYALAQAILSPLAWYLRFRFFFYKVVTAPSTSLSDQKRGFNHVHALCKGVGWKPRFVFEKEDDWKQSDKNFFERKQVAQHIRLVGKINTRRAYLIVDDIVTSGQTLLACAALLKKQGVKKIVLLAIANNQRK